MQGVARRLVGFGTPIYIGLLLVCLFPLWPGRVYADSTEGSVTISTDIAPVRDILLDSHGVIKEIVSNTSEDVVPTVYVMSYKSSPVVLTPNVYRQYAAIIATIHDRHMGIVYSAQNTSPSLTAASVLSIYPMSLLPIARGRKRTATFTKICDRYFVLKRA